MEQFSVLKLRLSTITLEYISPHIRRKGDLSRVIEWVMGEVDWQKIVPYDRRHLPETFGSGSSNTSVSVPLELHQQLKEHAKQLKTSPGRIIEGAIHLWAASQSKPSESESGFLG